MTNSCDTPISAQPFMIRFLFYFLNFTGLVFLLSGCAAPPRLVIWASRPMIEGAMQALMSETDLEFAQSSFEPNLKLIDGFLELNPDDYQLLTLASKGYAGYAMIYLEDHDPVRASQFYDRALVYGFRALSSAGYDFSNSPKSFRQFREEVSDLKRRDIHAVYWTALAWAGKINLNRTSASAIANFPRVLLLMEWVASHDSHFFYSGPLWFFGMYYSSIPEMLGGGTKRAKPYFDQAVKADGDRFLLGKVWLAENFSVQNLDRIQFLKTLGEVVSGSENEPSELRLINRYAQLKAADLISKVNVIFD